MWSHLGAKPEHKGSRHRGVSLVRKGVKYHPVESFFWGIFRDLISKVLFEKSSKLILGF